MKRCYPCEQLGFWLEKRFVQFVKKTPFGRKKVVGSCVCSEGLTEKKSEGDSQYEEEDEGEEDETNYTSSREVENFFFRSERPSIVLLFLKIHFKKKLTRKAVLDGIRLSKKNIHSFSSTVSLFSENFTRGFRETNDLHARGFYAQGI